MGAAEGIEAVAGAEAAAELVVAAGGTGFDVAHAGVATTKARAR
jgi:hypothetical protein